MAVVSGKSSSVHVIENKKSNVLPIASDNYFVYPYDLIDYSVSGSSMIEFNLNINGEVENLRIIESLGIPFDKSIIDGLSDYVSKKIISSRDNLKNQYRLEIKFEN
ncbi:MAG: energy transducer TonB [Candidatus Neomarinimicrobiota bacterium]